MLTEGFCRQYRVFTSQEANGQWCLHYLTPLLPWVYLYASSLLPHPLVLREITTSEYEFWISNRDEEKVIAEDTVDLAVATVTSSCQELERSELRHSLLP
ncbi:MAG TPA: hypothetical protein VGL07_13285 [Buttiauxella sp.]|jgi:hypothetical protein